MECPNCKAQVEPGLLFCPSCGKIVKAEVQSQPKPPEILQPVANSEDLETQQILAGQIAVSQEPAMQYSDLLQKEERPTSESSQEHGVEFEIIRPPYEDKRRIKHDLPTLSPKVIIIVAIALVLIFAIIVSFILLDDNSETNATTEVDTTTAYLAVKDGLVAIYKSDSDAPYRITDIEVVDLDSNAAASLDSKPVFQTVEEAEQYLTELEESISISKSEKNEQQTWFGSIKETEGGVVLNDISGIEGVYHDRRKKPTKSHGFYESLTLSNAEVDEDGMFGSCDFEVRWVSETDEPIENGEAVFYGTMGIYYDPKHPTVLLGSYGGEDFWCEAELSDGVFELVDGSMRPGRINDPDHRIGLSMILYK